MSCMRWLLLVGTIFFLLRSLLWGLLCGYNYWWETFFSLPTYPMPGCEGVDCVYFILRPVAIFSVTTSLLEYSAGGFVCCVPGGASPVGIKVLIGKCYRIACRQLCVRVGCILTWVELRGCVSVLESRISVWPCGGMWGRVGPSVSAGCGVSPSCRVQIAPGRDRCEVSLCIFEYCVMKS
jgi:hypothetical protein